MDSIKMRASRTLHDPAYRAMVMRLRDVRCRRGLTQVQAAQAAGASRYWLGKVERCDARLGVLQLANLCRVYCLPVDQLVRCLTKEAPP